MITEYDIYSAFKRADSRLTGKALRLTKNWESYFKTSISARDRVYLTETSKYFNTKWLSIDLDTYMDHGFKLYRTISNPKSCPQCDAVPQLTKTFRECFECGYDFRKGFSYDKLLRPNIMVSYIKQDKVVKRHSNISTNSIQKSFDWINGFMKDKKIPDHYTKLQFYCKCKSGQGRVLIDHYTKNRIDNVLFVYCLYYKYITLTDIEKEKCYNVVNRYRDLLDRMFIMENFIKELENE